MAVTIQLPTDVEKRLRAEFADLDTEAKETLALDLFRRGKLSHYELSKVLDLDRVKTDAFLKRHNDLYPYMIEGSVDSSVIIECFDQLSTQIDKRSYVLLDNAPPEDTAPLTYTIDNTAPATSLVVKAIAGTSNV